MICSVLFFSLASTVVNGINFNDDPDGVIIPGHYIQNGIQCDCGGSNILFPGPLGNLHQGNQLIAPTPPPSPPPTNPPTMPPRLQPTVDEIYWLEQPTMRATAEKCSEACHKDALDRGLKHGEGRCHEFEYDDFYHTCYLYKKVYINPTDEYSKFTAEQKLEWAESNAEKPYYRTNAEHTGLLRVFLHEAFGMSVDEMTKDLNGLVNESLSQKTRDNLRMNELMEYRQRLLLEKIMDTFSEGWRPEEKMILLMETLFAKSGNTFVYLLNHLNGAHD